MTGIVRRIHTSRSPYRDLVALRWAADYFASKHRFAADVIAKVLRRHAEHVERRIADGSVEEARQALMDVQSLAAMLVADASQAYADAQKRAQQEPA